MTTIAIIQARMTSTRLPGKVLKPLGSMPILGWIHRAASHIHDIDKVVIATSDDTSDDPIIEWCINNGIDYHRGSLDDVLQRYIKTAEAYDADIIMRLTADCPLLDPDVCAEVLQLLKSTRADYASNIILRTWPIGLDCEACTFDTLKKADEHATTTYDREHVTPYIYQHQDQFHIENLACPSPNLGKERLTLDYPEDYMLLQSLLPFLPEDRPPNYPEILSVFQKHPEFKKINSKYS